MTVVDPRDFAFLFRWLDLGSLLRRERFAQHGVQDVDAMLDVTRQIASTHFASHLRAGDIREPTVDAQGNVSVLPEVAQAVRVMADAGLFATVFDGAQGGLQLPHLVHVAALGTLMSGNLATASFALLTVGNARLIATYGSAAQVAAFAEPQIAGSTMGTMCLSEPHAGSSLAEIRTRATPEGADDLGERYRLSGSKMWISAGDHDITDNIVHLVLAKVPDVNGRLADDTRGISLFVVPKILPDGQRNDVVVSGLNHKMGYRALPNAALNFGEGAHAPDGRAGAIGWMIGAPGRGLTQMFQMMNEARISVGLAATMLACRGYLLSLRYARERLQGRAAGSAEPVAIIRHPDVRRMLLAQRAISQGALALVLFSARLLDDESTAGSEQDRAEAAALLALLTPVTKTWPSEWAQQSLHHALQIHGGAGYTRDFEIELLYRDNRLNPIHEGTTGIQGLDLIGRKLRRDQGAAFRALTARIGATLADAMCEGAETVGLASVAEAVARALATVITAVEILVAEPDEAQAAAHGTSFLFAFGHLVVGWLWLEQAIAALRLSQANDPDFEAGWLESRIRAARYFAEVELPSVTAWTDPILRRSTLILDTTEADFS